MTPKAEITKYRTMCLVHRYLYYVKAEPIIGDYEYDMVERKVRELVSAHPDIAAKEGLNSFCPVSNVGSSNADDYPRRIEQLAESLLTYHKKGGR